MTEPGGYNKQFHPPRLSKQLTIIGLMCRPSCLAPCASYSFLSSRKPSARLHRHTADYRHVTTLADICEGLSIRGL
eukprot:1228-Eustigmatos_ZCMA.PRE.1